MTINIFKLFSHILSKAETDLLSKGLSFCPTARINEFDLFIDLNSFVRRLSLIRHFENSKHNAPMISSVPNMVYTDLSKSPPPIVTDLRPKSNF